MSLLEDPHALVSASDSEADSASLCGSELELEMAWGEGPIAPLRAAAATATNGASASSIADGASSSAATATAPAPVVRSKSVGNGSSRARTPQKRATTPELSASRAKRMININPIRSAAYLTRPNELPVGVRKQQRWFNGASSVSESARAAGCVWRLMGCSSAHLTTDRPPLWQPRGDDASRGPHGAHVDQRRVEVRAPSCRVMPSCNPTRR